jgi:YVTN family beta-propeller protein
MGLATAYSAQAGAGERLGGHTPPRVLDGTAKLVGHFNPSQMLRLVFGVHPPHMAEEEQFLIDLHTKGSPQFHHFLTAEEWDARFAPSTEDEQAVVDWAEGQGFTVTHRYPNRLLVDVEAPVATTERAFDVTINSYQLGASFFFSNDRDPLLPVSLLSIIHSVDGLNNLQVMHSVMKGAKESARGPVYVPGPVESVGPSMQSNSDPAKLPARLSDGSQGGVTPNITNGYYDPTDIYSSNAYDFAALNALGHCCNPNNLSTGSPPAASIAIAAFGDVSFTDLSVFLNQYHLSENVSKVPVAGGYSCGNDDDNCLETTMDTEYALAMANSFGSSVNTAHVFVYEGANQNNSTFTTMYNLMLTEGYARVFSTSWSCTEIYGCSTATMDTRHAIFNTMVGQGWTLVAASGDRGATDNCENKSVSYPASDPDFVAAGGTTLQLNSDGTYNSEVGWSGGPEGCAANDGGSGGGLSSYYCNALAPQYQAPLGLACRALPDMALNADWYNTPQNIYFNGTLQPNGGTSIVAPELAGFFAQENAYLLWLGNDCRGGPCSPMGNVNYYVYSEGFQNIAPHNPFYDITSGCNSNDVTAANNITPYCASTSSDYNEVTGWGSANMLQLAWAINTFLADDEGFPTVTFTSGPPTNKWYNTDQTVNWDASESSAPGYTSNPVAGFSRAWDSDPGDPPSEPTPGTGNSFYSGPQFPNTSTGSFNLASAGSQGCHTLNVRAWDNIGFSSDYQYGPLCYDTIPPHTVASVTGTTAVQVTLTATDSGSGVASTVYQIDGGPVQTYTGPFNVSSVGDHTVTFHSTDNAGNVEVTESVSFTVSSNPAPGVPTLTSPANGASLTAGTTQVSLQWSAVAGATGYDVKVYTGSCGGALWDIVTINNTVSKLGISGLSTGLTYYWQVQSLGSGGAASAYSNCFDFSVDPPAPTGLMPANGATEVSLTPTLSWSASSGATAYDVYLGTTNTPSLAISNITATSYAPFTLSASTTYYWYVVAKNTQGSTNSATFSFTTGAAPAAPTGLVPTNGATGVSLTPTLSWSAASGATAYGVYLGTTNSPALAISNITATSYAPPALSAGTTYYWYVVATNSYGSTSSGTIYFTTSAAIVTYTISGQVTLNGNGLSGVTMTLTGSSSGTTTTDSFGNYSFTVNAGGSYAVTPSLPNYTFSPPSATFSSLSANQTANFTASIVTETTVVTAGFPLALGVNTATNQIYVTDWVDNLGVDGGNVTVIDGATNNTVTIPVGNGPDSVAVNPLTNTIYIANNSPFSFSGSVSVIDGNTNTVTATISTGCSLAEVAVNPVTNQIYVVGYWAGCNLLTVIDGATNTLTSLPAGSEPARVAVNQTTNKIYVPNMGDNTVTVIDGATNTTSIVAVGATPVDVAVNEYTNQIYVVSQGSNSVTVIDGATNNTISIPVGSDAYTLAVNPITNKIYVSNAGDNTVTIIDGATNNTLTVPAGNQPRAVAINTQTNQIYAANYGYGDNTVTLIDGATNTTTSVPVAGNQPITLAVNPVTNTIYVGAGGSNEHGHTDNVTVVNGAFITPPLSFSPTGLTFGPQPVGTGSSSQTVTLTNTSTASLAVSSIAASGDFAQTNDCGSSLAAGGACTISVTFTPTMSGNRTGWIMITDTASNSLQSFSLTGTGTTPVAGVSPSSLTFSNQAVGTSSASQPLTLSNTGNATLSIASMGISGANPTDFSVSANTCASTLAANGTCTVSVTFTPAAAGSRSGTLIITDDSGGVAGSTQTVTLTGTGTAPVLLSMVVTPANPSIPVGNMQQFTATGTYSDGSMQNLTSTATWSSSATGVATISTTGLASGVAVGQTSIEAASGTIDGSTTLTVTVGFVYAGSLNTARFGHTATLLNNGMVLMAGGANSPGVYLASAELYNPATATFTPTGSMNTVRYLPTATLLNNGMVLIAGGGGSSGLLASAELYNPATGTFTPTGSMNTARVGHTATLLNNGLVLLAGGSSSSDVLATAELYDPATGTFTYTNGSLSAARFQPTATLLNNGLVLIAGGEAPMGTLASAELYNPATGTFTPNGSMNTARTGHTATLLNNGLVLMAGGQNDSSGRLASAELYNPATETFTATGSLNAARVYQTATLLNNGMVLVGGGSGNTGFLASAELYDPAAGTFTLTASLNTARFVDTATLLNNGMVLMAGGVTGAYPGVPVASAELYEPDTLTPPGLVSISLSPSNPTVPLDTAQRFTATGTFSNSSTQQLASVTWGSSNTAVASITDDASNLGAAYALAAGTATVSACAGAVCGSTTLTSAPAGPLVVLSSLSLPFGPQNVGVPSAPLTETVTNTGVNTLSISAATISGKNASAFAKSADTCTGATLMFNGTCTINVTFTPTTTGPLSGTLTITDNSNGVAGSTQTVTLSGTGVELVVRWPGPIVLPPRPPSRPVPLQPKP